MKKIILLLSLFAMSSLAIAVEPEGAVYYGDRMLICLQPDVAIQTIGHRNNNPVTGLESLDQLLELREITSMERFLPSATPDDMDEDIILSNIYRLQFDRTRSDVNQLIADFAKDTHILYAEAEVINRVLYTPNDSRFGNQWYMNKIDANEAWDLWDIVGGDIPGDIGIVLASVDSGVQYTHPDLWRRSWINQAEIPVDIFDAVDTNDDLYVSAEEVVAYIEDYDSNGSINLQDALHASSPFMNGVDDDNWDNNAGTFIDDLVGWDISGTTSGNDPDNDPMGAMSGADLSTRMHGTHVAGLLCAQTDNSTGIASVIFNGSLMSVKGLYDQDSQGFISGGLSGALYAAQAGADIINMSWGGVGYSGSSQATYNLIYNTYGALLVAAAGNGNDNGTPSSTPHYPSGYANVVSVTALGSSDNFSWANYGDGEGNDQFSGVSLSAPGENMHSTVYTNAGYYSSWNGTSMASPLVASCFGLLKSANPDQDNDWLVDNILSTTDPIDEINPNYAGQLGTGRINIHSALAHSIFPLLNYNSHSLQMVNDNGDGQLSPGEEALMRVNLYNEPGWVDAADVTAVLRSNSPYVTITDSTAVYGDIFNGNTGVNILDRYQFSIAADAPSGLFPFTLVVTANASTDHIYISMLDFSVEASIWQTNFPIASGVIKGGNAVVDLDGDGSMEIIFGAEDSLVHVIQADGSELPGFPLLLGHKIEATPAVGDVDNDGDLEIVIGSKDYNLYVIQHDGSSEIVYTSTRYIFAAATLYDLDGDGDLEIIAPCYNNDLAVVHHDGTPFGSFPIMMEDHMTVAAAVGDVNADGNLNIVVGTWNADVHVLNLDGTEAPGFPIVLTEKVKSAPVLANLDDSVDGSLEILFGCDDNNLHAYGSDGAELWTFATLGQNIQSDPAVCDMDGDGDLEIAFGGLDRRIYVLDHTGAILDGWPVTTAGIVYSSPAIADIDGDGEGELFVGSNDFFVYGLNLDGSSVSGFPTESSNKVQGSPSIVDFDGDNDVEVVIGTDDYLAVLDLPGSGELGGYWPTHRGNLHRTGALPTLVSTQGEDNLPTQFSLQANYPNPFNPSTQISFDIPEAGFVNLQILDIRGRVLASLVSRHLTPSSYTVTWNGQLAGKPVSAGIYLYRLSTANGNLIRKMTLLK